MSGALAAIGAAVVEVIGLNPQDISWEASANWASQPVFGEEPFIQPTGMGEESFTLRLATRPHELGGLDAIRALQEHMRAMEPIPYVRLVGEWGEYAGLVGIRRMSVAERAIAPSGVGWRMEVTVELVRLGRAAVGGF